MSPIFRNLGIIMIIVVAVAAVKNPNYKLAGESSLISKVLGLSNF